MINPLDVSMVYCVKRENNLGVTTVYDSRTSMVSTPTSPAVRSEEHRGLSLWGKFFKSVSRMPITHVAGKETTPGFLIYPPPVHAPPCIDFPLELKSVDLNIAKNTHGHNTELYHATKETKNTKLVVRRGTAFTVDLNFYREIDRAVDDLKLIFEIGSQPSISDCTRICLNITSQGPKLKEPGHDWQFIVEKSTNTSMQLKIRPSPNAILGSWNMKIVSALIKGGGTEDFGVDVDPFLDSQSLVRGIVIVFNPWCEDDLVYLSDEAKRFEYVLNDTGEIWRGCLANPIAYPWSYGQFEEGILDACLYMLDKSRLPHVHRSNPIQLSRVVCEMINSVSDTGVIVGNWTDSFEGGTAPTDWTGSTKILRQYHQTGQPVCFGQCWTFAGLLTTVLRCFGIPTRVITNYNSAHDSASTVSVNTFLKPNAKMDFDRSRDAMWCFHTWNEVWMSRPDLIDNYGGWQAIDATPQEKTDGFYAVGPSPVTAIKRGNIGSRYETQCFYAEVNADHRIFLASEDKEDLINIDDKMIGRLIVTRKIGEIKADEFEFEDITETYKQVLDSDRRHQVLKTMLPGYHASTPQDAGEIQIRLSMKKRYNFGQNFAVDVNMQNLSAEERVVKFWLRIESILYHHSAPYKVKVTKMVQKLQPNQSQTVPVVVTLQEYLGRSLPQTIFAATVVAVVEETGRTSCAMEYFCLNSPIVNLKIKNKRDDNVRITAELINPLPVQLTRCKFIVDGPGLISPTDMVCRDVSPHGAAQTDFVVVPKNHGFQKIVIVHFVCDQLSDVQGSIDLSSSNKQIRL